MPSNDPEIRRKHNVAYYQKNKNLYYEKNKEKRITVRKWLDTVKAVPCMDCGNSYPPCVMDFDHRDPKQKSFTISRTGQGVSRQKLEAEIAKCDIVCANCHRIRTHITRKA